MEMTGVLSGNSFCTEGILVLPSVPFSDCFCHLHHDVNISFPLDKLFCLAEPGSQAQVGAWVHKHNQRSRAAAFAQLFCYFCKLLFRQHREPAVQDSRSGNIYAASDDEASDPQTSTAGQASNHPLFNVMLTCYSLFERDSADQQADRSFLKKWDWSHLLLDEAHAVKNAMAMRTKRLTRCAAQFMD